MEETPSCRQTDKNLPWEDLFLALCRKDYSLLFKAWGDGSAVGAPNAALRAYASDWLRKVAAEMLAEAYEDIRRTDLNGPTNCTFHFVRPASDDNMLAITMIRGICEVENHSLLPASSRPQPSPPSPAPTAPSLSVRFLPSPPIFLPTHPTSLLILRAREIQEEDVDGDEDEDDPASIVGGGGGGGEDEEEEAAGVEDGSTPTGFSFQLLLVPTQAHTLSHTHRHKHKRAHKHESRHTDPSWPSHTDTDTSTRRHKHTHKRTQKNGGRHQPLVAADLCRGSALMAESGNGGGCVCV